MNLEMAWRNVWRNTRRTTLTALAVSFSCAILVFFNALQQSSYSAAIEASTSIMQGHVQVQSPGYQSRPQITNEIPDIRTLHSSLSQIQEVIGSAPRALGFALASTQQRSFGVQVMGVDPASEPLVSTIPKQIRAGDYLEEKSQDVEYQVVLGETLARNLRVEPGDEITLLGQGFDGSLAVGVFRVRGLYSSGSQDLDRAVLQIPLSTFQEVFSMGDAGHVIALRGKSVASAAQLVRVIEQKLSHAHTQSLAVLDWEALSPGLKQMIELDMASGWLFYFSLVLIVVFSVLNSFAMSLLERTREFGVLLAIGVSRLKISYMVFLESILLLLCGLIPGTFLGCAVIYYFHKVGFSVPGSEEVMKLWNLPVAIYPQFSIFAISLGPIVILLCSVLAVFVPIIRLRSLEPVEAMRAV